MHHTFSSLYSSISKCIELAGIGNILDTKAAGSETGKHFSACFYYIIILLPITYTVVCNVILLATTDPYNARLIAITSASTLTLFDTVYFLTRNNRTRSLFKNVNTITDTILADSNTINDNNILRHAMKLNSCFKYFVRVYVTLAVTMGVYLYASHYVTRTAELLTPVPYDVHCFPFLYEITLLVQSLSSAIVTIKEISVDGLIFALLFHLCLLLSHLRNCSKLVFSESTYPHGNEYDYSVAGKTKRSKRVLPTRSTGSRNFGNFISYNSMENEGSNVNTLKNWIVRHQDLIR